MPVQHVSDRVLTSMRRGITSVKLRRLVENIRSAVPGIALRTTLIAGYPTEGEEEFGELLEFVKEAQFDRLGVFTYSQEEGTWAYSLGDPVPQEVKDRRREQIMEAQSENSRRKNERLVGTNLKVLIDSVDPACGTEDGSAVGRTERDAPEVDNEVVVENAAGLLPGQFCDVKIVDAEEYDLFGVTINGSGSRPVDHET
jgi:ribosomal protein S12 methylthiotransferase